MRRKPFAILRYLVTNPGRLITHAELLEHVWGGAVVSESAMRSQLHELRQVLGDGVIDTVIGRGYRFAAAVVDGSPPERGTSADARASMVVGRDRELATPAVGARGRPPRRATDVLRDRRTSDLTARWDYWTDLAAPLDAVRRRYNVPPRIPRTATRAA